MTKNHSLLAISTPGLLSATILLFLMFAGRDASSRDLPGQTRTYHVEVLVQSTHVSENTTSTQWRTVLSTGWRELAEWYHAELLAEFAIQGDVFHLLYDNPSPVYDESVIDIRLRTETAFLRKSKR